MIMEFEFPRLFINREVVFSTKSRTKDWIVKRDSASDFEFF